MGRTLLGNNFVIGFRNLQDNKTFGIWGCFSSSFLPCPSCLYGTNHGEAVVCGWSSYPPSPVLSGILTNVYWNWRKKWVAIMKKKWKRGSSDMGKTTTWFSWDMCWHFVFCYPPRMKFHSFCLKNKKYHSNSCGNIAVHCSCFLLVLGTPVLGRGNSFGLR